MLSLAKSSSVGDKHKYRIPHPPPRPEWCWCFCRDRKGKKAVCDNLKDNEKCKEPVLPNEFDPISQLCLPGDHNFCFVLDMAMICGDKDMQFDTE